MKGTDGVRVSDGLRAARPEPTRERWQPLRIGFVELFHYDEQEWWFRDGRLLLRGNNGTGKSKVLALTLPFLLDGRVDGARVEPDGDRQKRMEWNLLLGDTHEHAERIGYSWVEFGRRAADGVAHHLTLGCGMKAVRGRPNVQQWLFVADRRVGDDLELTTADRVPLSRDRLEGALGDRGRVFHPGVAGDGGFRARYRRAVDERLFGLGERRYDALVDLLLQIRQPQLSKRPDERALSRALTDALPPLDGALIDDIATAFRTLENDREHVRRTAVARDAAAAYGDIYRRYARMAARRIAAGPRQAQARVDEVGRRIARAVEARDLAAAALANATERRDALRREDDELSTRRRALDVGDAAQSAKDLEHAATRARQTEQHRLQATSDAAQTRDRQVRTAAVYVEAQNRGAATIADLTAAIDQSVRAAAEAGIDARTLHEIRELWPGNDERSEVADVAGDTADEGPLGSARVARVRRTVEGSVASYGRAIGTLRGLLDVAAEQSAGLRLATAQLGDLEGEHAVAAEAVQRADGDVAEAADTYVAAVRQTFDALVELRIVDLDGVVERVDAWARTLDGDGPLDAALEDAALPAISVIDREGHAAETDHAATTERLSVLREKLTRLERGEWEEPPAPESRDPDARAGRAGLPFWQALEFADGVTDDDRAGLEAALQASGLLDAWLAPDGVLHGTRADGDAWVLAGDASPVEINASVWLRPSADLDDGQRETVDRVLGRIGTAPERSDAMVAVAPDGRWRHGLLAGRWQKLRPTFVGRPAREIERRARLAAVREEEQTILADLDRLDTLRARLDQRRQLVDQERRRRPDSAPLRTAHSAARNASGSARRVAELVAEAITRRDAAHAAVVASRDEVATTARDLGLPADDDTVTACQRALGDLRPALAALWPTLSRAADHAAGVAEAGRGLAEATSEAEKRDGRQADAESTARDAAVFFEQLQEQVGAEVADLQAKRTRIDARRAALRDEQTATEAAREKQMRVEAATDAQLTEHQESLERESLERTAASERLWRFARTGVLAVARPEIELPDRDVPWNATAAVAVARRIEQAEQDAGATTSDEAWQRALARTQDELAPLAEALSLSGDRVALRTVDDGTFVVDIIFRGRDVSIAELAGELGHDVEERRRVLDEKEREILENHLIDEVAATLQQRIGDAEQQVERMNAELAVRPTSTGMRLRLRWALADDAPAGLATARQRLMRQRSAVWSIEDREAVGAFLQAQIQALRAEDPSRPWHEHLATAFDYRGWHRFVVERHQAGRWTSATGPASGGERVLAATLPLFAAASAHCASAPNPHAPRLVLLDEAFAGVDDDARAKCLGLLAEFDLDVVMTSEREWGCYPEVPGLAIAQLSRTDGIDAILVTPWEWDGRARSRTALPEPEPATAAERGADDDGQHHLGRTSGLAAGPMPGSGPLSGDRSAEWVDTDQTSLLDAADES